MAVNGQENPVVNGTSVRPTSGKALSVFQVVRFPNIGCNGSSSYNGTCYTASECLNKGGTNAGSCANGFGVCCTFTLGCGSTISENCSYFVSSSSVLSGTCSATVCECSTDICQLRLDFTTFVISGPSTVTFTQFYSNAGAAVPVATQQASPTNVPVASNYATRCLTDQFSVTGNAASPPIICGTNSGYHMYVDSSAACNTLSFQMNPAAATGITLATRSWNIKISQISCFSQWLAPQGCTQYFTGTSGYIYSYNYNPTTPSSSVQLANQQQSICFRRERGYCRLCVTPTSMTNTLDFAVSSMASIGLWTTQCCGYGAGVLTAVAGMSKGFDCLVIPGAMLPAGAIFANNHFCGGALGTAAINTASTVCTSLQPFNIEFLTDAITVAVVGTTRKYGFRLQWFLTTC